MRAKSTSSNNLEGVNNNKTGISKERDAKVVKDLLRVKIGILSREERGIKREYFRGQD